MAEGCGDGDHVKSPRRHDALVMEWGVGLAKRERHNIIMEIKKLVNDNNIHNVEASFQWSDMVWIRLAQCTFRGVCIVKRGTQHPKQVYCTTPVAPWIDSKQYSMVIQR